MSTTNVTHAPPTNEEVELNSAEVPTNEEVELNSAEVPPNADLKVPSAELPTNEQHILPTKDDSADQPSKKRSREEIGQEKCCQECMIAESVMKRLLRSPEFVRMLQSMPHGESREVRVVQTAQGVTVHMKVPPAPEEQPSEKH